MSEMAKARAHCVSFIRRAHPYTWDKCMASVACDHPLAPRKRNRDGVPGRKFLAPHAYFYFNQTYVALLVAKVEGAVSVNLPDNRFEEPASAWFVDLAEWRGLKQRNDVNFFKDYGNERVARLRELHGDYPELRHYFFDLGATDEELERLIEDNLKPVLRMQSSHENFIDLGFEYLQPYQLEDLDDPIRLYYETLRGRMKKMIDNRLRFFHREAEAKYHDTSRHVM